MPAGTRAGRRGDPADPGPVRPGPTAFRRSRARPHRARAGPGARVAERSAPSLRGAVRMNPPIRLYMSMSLDGFIAGPDDRAGQELGRDGGRLFYWLDDRMSEGPNGQVFRELMATGAVIS